MEPTEGNKKERPQLVQCVAPNGFKVPFPEGPWVPLDVLSKFNARPDDVLIATYPKAGTSWAQEITWLICNNADTNEAKKKPMFVRVPFLEVFDFEGVIGGIKSLDDWPKNKQRVIKTHLPYQVLPDQFVGEKAHGKIIVFARNAKDTCVSYYYFHLMCALFPEPGNWSEFLDKFYAGELLFGSWFDHVRKYWQEYEKDKDRIHFVTYERLKKDLRSEVASLAKFLGKELTDEQIDKIVEHCSFESMGKNEQTNASQLSGIFDFKISKFLRKGQVGEWKNHFTVNQNETFDKYYEEKMKGAGLTIPFEV